MSRYYQWNLIVQGEDDNKFVDAAMAGNAKFIITHDKHFEILNKIPFPKIETLEAKVFIEEELKANIDK